jgi:hypothetical protein
MALNLPAQTGSGEIHLQVTDPSGAPMQASVRVRGQKAKLDRTVITNAKSPTVLANLPFGRYRLEVSKAGFATQAFAIDVNSAAPVERTVAMTLAAQATGGHGSAVGRNPGAGADRQRQGYPADRCAGPIRPLESEARQRSHQPKRRESI